MITMLIALALGGCTDRRVEPDDSQADDSQLVDDSQADDSAEPEVTGPWAELDIGHFELCGLNAQGEIRCWGESGADYTALGAGPWKDIGVGYDFVCAVSLAGEIACDGAGAEDAPDGDGWASVSGDQDYACALSDEGEAVCWGFGAPEMPGWEYTFLTAGHLTACGITTEEKVVCRGESAITPSGLGEVIDVSSAYGGVCALLADGSLSCWDPAGDGLDPAPDLPTLSDVEITSLNNVCGLDSEGLPRCWVADLAEGEPYPLIDDLPSDVRASAMVRGGGSACVITRNAQAGYCWGYLEDLDWPQTF